MNTHHSILNFLKIINNIKFNLVAIVYSLNLKTSIYKIYTSMSFSLYFFFFIF